MKILIAGGTGATGKHLVNQLLQKGHEVVAIVRTPEKLTDFLDSTKNLDIIQASILDINDDQMAAYVADCDALASCLGHNLTLKGIFGSPRKLVTDAVKKMCKASTSKKSKVPIKFILMNTSGNRNKDLGEKFTLGEKIVIGLVRLLVPPQSDNENASEYLRTQIGHDHPSIHWVAVRPDGLINEEEVSPYEIHPSPIRSAIFNAGKTSRINVAHFMSELITNESIWKKWKGQMPLIYNKET